MPHPKGRITLIILVFYLSESRSTQKDSTEELLRFVTNTRVDASSNTSPNLLTFKTNLYLSSIYS